MRTDNFDPTNAAGLDANCLGRAGDAKSLASCRNNLNHPESF